jgi:hypothetical protein
MNVPRAMVGERKIDHGDRRAGFSGIVGFGILFFGRLCQRRRNDVGNVWRPLPRIYDANLLRYPVDLLTSGVQDPEAPRQTPSNAIVTSGSVTFPQHLPEKALVDGMIGAPLIASHRLSF